VPAIRDTEVTLRDGRRLAYTEWGTAAGTPVLFFHGTPGSRLWCPDEAATIDARVRLIAPDRPGIGASDPKDRRTLGDWPADVEELADALGISSFAVVGVSAGGIYAAACAALIPARLTGVAIVSSRAPAQYNWEARPGIELEWTADDQSFFELTRQDPDAGADAAAADFAAFAAEFDRNPEQLHEGLMQAEGDRWFFEDPGRVELFDASLRETWRQGFDALKWEMVDAFQPWGFRLTDIPIHVHVLHGSQDPRVKYADIDWQVREIPRASLVVWRDSGHLGFVKHWSEILAALVASAEEPNGPA
jgi:pimeloyl-ACP methyl ester carboxylesterase